MKNIHLLILLTLIFSCKGKDKNNNRQPASLKDISLNNRSATLDDSLDWVTSFHEFRNAVYKKDIIKVKQFIDFPIKNENNEIWYLVYNSDSKEIELLSQKIKPFTEQDLDKYFDSLFSKRFINAILKIKSEDLYKTGTSETLELKDNGNTTYKMYAEFDKKENNLTLHLFSNTIIKDDNGEVQDGGEFSIIYQFTVLKDGHIKFRQIRLAG